MSHNLIRIWSGLVFVFLTAFSQVAKVHEERCQTLDTSTF